MLAFVVARAHVWRPFGRVAPVFTSAFFGRLASVIRVAIATSRGLSAVATSSSRLVPAAVFPLSFALGIAPVVAERFFFF